MKKIEFTKMHGLGNDYIYVNTMKYPIDHPEQLAIEWSKPHTGIGSDGLVLIGKPTKDGDFSMRIFNADGSEAKMCGNASRCIGKYLYEYGLTDKTEIKLETLSGIKILRLKVDSDNMVETVTVDMGIPTEIVTVNLGEGYGFSQGISVSMGNPHLVIFVDDIKKVDIEKVGSQLEHHPLFPDRVNVEFAQVLKSSTDGESVIRMRVWERGSGITQACGTGSCATTVAAAYTARCGYVSEIIMDGGNLHNRWVGIGGHLFMTGTATKVFDGTIELKD